MCLLYAMSCTLYDSESVPVKEGNMIKLEINDLPLVRWISNIILKDKTFAAENRNEY